MTQPLTFIDSHCHLDMLTKAEDGHVAKSLTEILDAASAHQVDKMLCVAVDTERFVTMKALCAPQQARIAISAGVHPCYVDENHAFDLTTLTEQANDPQVIAIGETGLDFFHRAEDAIKALQYQAFEAQIALANSLQKPLIIHTRGAKSETIAMLQNYHAEKAGGVMHCFTEDLETARAALDLGFYISFSGILTFKNAAALREVCAYVPMDRLLIETDSPYLAPVPHRGKTNQPAWVAHVAETVANVKAISLETVASATTDNFYRLFSRAAQVFATG